MKLLHCLLLVGAVASVPATLPAQDTAKPKIRRSANLITREEIQTFAPNAETAYDVVKQLRSLWLHQRGPSSITQTTQEVQVYVNELLRGGPSTLREIQSVNVRELQRLSPSDASQRYGTNHENGAILVTLRSRP